MPSHEFAANSMRWPTNDAECMDASPPLFETKPSFQYPPMKRSKPALEDGMAQLVDKGPGRCGQA